MAHNQTQAYMIWTIWCNAQWEKVKK